MFIARKLCKKERKRIFHVFICVAFDEHSSFSYNRARGTSLISPQDLYRAAVLMDELSLPLQLHEFASGVRVLKQRGQENALESRIRALFADKKPRTALEVCEALSVSMSVTMEELKALEQSAFLCRDEAISGVTFYFNPWKQEQKAV